MRARALKLNAITNLISEIISLVSGLILPRLILTTFGSTTNGLVNSIAQFLSFSVVLRAGVGAVIRTALYKPLASNDDDQISSIMVATQAYMRKVALIISACVFMFAIVYPFLVADEYEWLYAFAMVLVLGITVFAENFFGISNIILLQADQKYYITTVAMIIMQILSCVTSIVLLNCGFDMLVVKLGASIVFLAKPAFLEWYVRKNYHIDKKALPNNLAIKQRWDAFAQQLAIIINGNISIVLITTFTALTSVSVYTVHSMIVSNIAKIAKAPLAGINSAFGSMLAKKETKVLHEVFSFIEWGSFAMCTVLYAVTAVMITPFVDVYTRSIVDVNYHQPIFGFLLVLVNLLNCLRIPYQMVTEAAGHFKQTRNGAILEVVVNIVVSVVLLKQMGITGVVIGSLTACLIRTLQYSRYAAKNVLQIPTWRVYKNYVVYLLTFFICVIASEWFVLTEIRSYYLWIINAVKSTVITTAIVVLISLVFNSDDVKYLWKRIQAKRL